MKKSLKDKTWSQAWLAPMIVLAAASAALYVTGVFAHADENPISNYYEVAPNNKCAAGQGAGHRDPKTIFRGAAPDEAGLRYLSAHGIKTILGFQTASQNRDEQELVEQLGLALNDISHPMDGGMGVNKLPNGQYDNDSIISAIADMRRAENFPEFVHCTYGDDRTGMLVAFHRVFNECWDPKDAENEWSQIEGWLHHMFHIPKHEYFHYVMNTPELRQYFVDQLEKQVPAAGAVDSGN